MIIIKIYNNINNNDIDNNCQNEIYFIIKMKKILEEIKRIKLIINKSFEEIGKKLMKKEEVQKN